MDRSVYSFVKIQDGMGDAGLPVRFKCEFLGGAKFRYSVHGEWNGSPFEFSLEATHRESTPAALWETVLNCRRVLDARVQKLVEDSR